MNISKELKEKLVCTVLILIGLFSVLMVVSPLLFSAIFIMLRAEGSCP